MAAEHPEQVPSSERYFPEVTTGTIAAASRLGGEDRLFAPEIVEQFLREQPAMAHFLGFWAEARCAGGVVSPLELVNDALAMQYKLLHEQQQAQPQGE